MASSSDSDHSLHDLAKYRPHGILGINGLVSSALSAFNTLPLPVRLLTSASDCVARHERIQLSDGGEVNLCHLSPSEAVLASGTWVDRRTCVVCLPGINTSSTSRYLQQQCELLCNRGYHAAILDYRGTGGMRLDATSPPVAGAADSWKVGIWG